MNAANNFPNKTSNIPVLIVSGIIFIAFMVYLETNQNFYTYLRGE